MSQRASTVKIWLLEKEVDSRPMGYQEGVSKKSNDVFKIIVIVDEADIFY